MLSPPSCPTFRHDNVFIKPSPLVKQLSVWLEVDTAEEPAKQAESNKARGTANGLLPRYDDIIGLAILQTPNMNPMACHIQKPTKDRNREQSLTLEQCLSV